LKFHCSCATFLVPDPDDDIAEGQTVLVIGNPEGLQGTVCNALVAANSRRSKSNSIYSSDFTWLKIWLFSELMAGHLLGVI
jgi:S1-C subfamily serine protease